MLSSLLAIAWLAATPTPDGSPLEWEGVFPLPEDGWLSEAGVDFLQAQIDAGIDAELHWSDFRDLRAELRRFYRDRGWRLAWMHGARPTSQAWLLGGALDGAERKGLDPADYGGAWEARLAAIDRSGAREVERIRLDVAFTVSTLRYGSDLALGRILPIPGSEPLGRSQLARDAGPGVDLVRTIETAADAADPGAALAEVEPPWPAYLRTLDALEKLLSRSAAAEPEPLPAPARGPVAPERYAQLERLAERLRQLGDLDHEEEQGQPITDGACASPLADAVVRFQSRHGLDATGFVDESTIRELNVARGRRAAQLGLALERWRWLPRRFAAAPLVVNVPEFRLWSANGGPPLSMRVVVGQAYRWGTPVFASELARVVFRPSWTAPPWIQERELLPRIEAEPALLDGGDFEVIDSADQLVRRSAAEAIAGIASGALRLRQRPGPENALGLIRFDFSNAGWIYLHGTPGQELFARSRRDFSHGCIRVEDPVALAEWVLRDDPRFTREAIRHAMDGGRTLEVALARPVPVVVGYFTATVSPAGELRFFDDIYGHDAALALALEEESARRGAR